MVPLSMPRNLTGFANTLDQVFVQLVTRFRRVPNLRLFVIFYIVVMQMIMIAFIYHYRSAKHQ